MNEIVLSKLPHLLFWLSKMKQPAGDIRVGMRVRDEGVSEGRMVKFSIF